MFAVAGCSDAELQSIAADRAREYLLEHCPELTAEQVSYVRFNQPDFLVGSSIGSTTPGKMEQCNSYTREISAAWRIPGADRVYMVYGISDGRMFHWYPNRLIKRRFDHLGLTQRVALDLCRSYARENFQADLSDKEYAGVRFGYPRIIESDFDVNYNGDASLAEEEIETRRLANAALSQFSLVWNFDDKYVVFSGYSRADLSGWNIIFAGILGGEEVREHTLRVVKEPAEFTRPIPVAPFEAAPEDEDFFRIDED
ncbi:MAG: hypothetical protein MJ025_03140 [Victivallaceae bacterium]|nr:hypothetical protein [Victivallaceae bacterium]